MTECAVCEELLAKYIEAGNEVIDRRKQLQRRSARTSRELAKFLVETAVRQRIRLSRSLRLHRLQHGC